MGREALGRMAVCDWSEIVASVTINKLEGPALKVVQLTACPGFCAV